MVDIPTGCKVCGQNLSAPAETCGDACARVLRYGETPEVARVRAKIALCAAPCGDNCPGWAVFNADTDPRLERCDECWQGDADPLMDDDIEVLPEAQQELSLAEVDGGAYERPDIGSPCTCGCVVHHRASAGGLTCSGCGATLPPTAALRDADNPIFRAVLAAMDEAEGLHGPDGNDYRRLMTAIECEARKRRETYDREQ